VGRAHWDQGQHGLHQPCPSRFGLDAKKKTLRASERNEAERATWRKQAATLQSADLVFVDETGSHIAMTPLYAYAPKGQRAIGSVPRNYGASMTLIASLSLDGMGEALMLDGAADGAAFDLYIEQLLAPSLRPGQIVILDNLSIHLGSRVKQAIEARGCRLLFLPAYSPDFSPIEEAFSKLKSILRRAGARTREALQEAIATALDLITATDAHGWFTHCGYLPSSSTEQVQELCTPL
jgi:transposase